MSLLIRTTLASLAFAGTASLSLLMSAATANAEIITASLPGKTGQSFTKKKYNIKGHWNVVQENGRTIIRFSDDFKTKNGPDLKIFLSPQSVGNATGKTALEGAVTLGALKSNKGTQDYVVPNGVYLANFSSVLIHCEAYSVLWGGGSRIFARAYPKERSHVTVENNISLKPYPSSRIYFLRCSEIWCREYCL